MTLKYCTDFSIISFNLARMSGPWYRFSVQISHITDWIELFGTEYLGHVPDQVSWYWFSGLEVKVKLSGPEIQYQSVPISTSTNFRSGPGIPGHKHRFENRTELCIRKNLILFPTQTKKSFLAYIAAYMISLKSFEFERNWKIHRFRTIEYLSMMTIPSIMVYSSHIQVCHNNKRFLQFDP